MRTAVRALSMALAVGFSLVPFAWIVLTSLKSPAAVGAVPPRLLPDGSLQAYRTILSTEGLLRPIRTSLVVAGSTTLASVLLGALAAYALVRLELPGRRKVLALVLALSMFPQIALVGGVYRILRALGLLNTVPGLVLPYVSLTLPMCIWMLAVFFREIPRDLGDAARVDGCGPLSALFRVFLPVAAPAVFTTAILVFIQAWNEFFLALLIGVETLPVGIAKYPGEHEVPWAELAAAAVLATLPLVALVGLLQRRIVSGLTAGAVKG